MDVDGVLNGVGASPGAGGWSPEKWERFEVNGYLITFHHDLMNQLREIEARDDVSFFWLTTWCRDAPRLLSPTFGLGSQWPVVGEDEYLSSGAPYNWWKYPAISEHLAETQPDRFVWLDDHTARVLLELPDRIEEVPGLSLSPNTRVGLSKSHLTQIHDFLE